jgi:hypothetical protein
MQKSSKLSKRCSAGALAAALCLGRTAQAQFAVVPSTYANLEPGSEIGEIINGYGSTTGQTIQYVIPASEMTALSGQQLTGLAFRLNNTYDPVLGQITYANFTIILSPFAGSSLSSTFADNISSPTTVLSGPHTTVAGAYAAGASGSTPNAFGDFFTFTTGYNYSGGDLLVTIQHAQPAGPPSSPYWSADSATSTLGTEIAHDQSATSAGIRVGLAPVTEFTDAPLNADGTLVNTPEPSTLLLGGLGAGVCCLIRRRRTS